MPSHTRIRKTRPGGRVAQRSRADPGNPASGAGNQAMQSRTKRASSVRSSGHGVSSEQNHTLPEDRMRSLRRCVQSGDPAREGAAEELGRAMLQTPADKGPAPIGNAASLTAPSGTVPSGGKTLGSTPFGDAIRLHTGPEAAAMAAVIGARAYAIGSDIVFAADQYRPGTSDGDALLAHEIGHVVQQSQDGATRLERYPHPDGPLVGEALRVTGPFWSDTVQLEGGEMVTSVEAAADGHVMVELPTPHKMAGVRFLIPLGLVDPFDAPEGDPVLMPGGLFPPVQIGPAELLPEIPEGVVVQIDPSELPQSSIRLAAAGQDNAQRRVGLDVAGGVFSWAGRAMQSAVNEHQMSYGFRAAGDNAAGLVGYPNVFNKNFLKKPFNPLQSPILLGHTIAYVRVDGKIHTVTSFAPHSLVDAGIDAARRTFGGKSLGVEADIIQHLDPQDFPLSLSGTHGFSHTAGVSIEWPITADAARNLSTQLSGADAKALGQYAAYLEDCAGNQNCVAWALDQIEPTLQGQIGEVGQATLRDSNSRQGVFQRMANRALKVQDAGGDVGSVLSDLPGATGDPAVGKMSTTMKVVKWGGYIFEVGGYALSAHNIWTASDEELPFVMAEEAITTAAGPAGLIATEFYIKPMKDLAKGEGDATLLILPIPYIAPAVRILEPEKHDPEGGRVIRKAAAGDPGAIQYILYKLSGF